MSTGLSGERDRPLISICCLTYNQKKFISQAIEGFLAQKTTCPTEIIIHDDASTDGTSDIIRQYEKKYSNLIKPIYQAENQHAKGVQNYATWVLPRARGQYIALCDGDDYWTDPYKLQKQADFLDQHPDHVICFHDTIRINEDGEPLAQPRRPRRAKATLELKDLLRWNIISACTVMFRRGLFTEYPSWYFDAWMGDYPLHILNAQYGKIGHLNEVMATYRVHGHGAKSWISTTKQYEGTIQMLEQVNGYLGYRYEATIAKSIAENLYDAVSAHANTGDIIGARKYALEGIRKYRRYLRPWRLAMILSRVYAVKAIEAARGVRKSMRSG